MKICKICKLEKQLIDFPIKASNKDGYNTECKICHNQKTRTRYATNPEKKLAKNKQWKENNLEQFKVISKICCKRWKENNLERWTELKKKYRPKEKEQRRFKYNTDPLFKLNEILRNRLYETLSRHHNSKTLLKYVGCSIPELKEHLEKQWQEGMSWANWGAEHNKGFRCWHIDHKICLDSFNFTNEEEIKKAWHYSNLQPLWQKDNLSKGNRL